MDIYSIIKKPLITEKLTMLKDNNIYIFAVDKNANKTQIKQAVEKLFNVKVIDVHTCNMHGKMRRVRLHVGKRPDWKKAYVKLAPGQKIEFIETEVSAATSTAPTS
jgi:large subunit ribosomal protein L23